MIVRFGVGPRRRGLDTERFQKHWREIHGPLIAKHLKNVRRYWQNHAVVRNAEALLPWPGFDACSELEFDDLVTLSTSLADEEYHRATDADSEQLLDRSKSGAVFTERILATGRIEMSGVRLMTFMRRAPARTVEQFRDGLQATPTASGAFARELFVALHGGEAPFSAFDAVEALWFEDARRAELYAISTEAREHRHRIAHLVRGVERLIARPLVFVAEQRQ